MLRPSLSGSAGTAGASRVVTSAGGRDGGADMHARLAGCAPPRAGPASAIGRARCRAGGKKCASGIEGAHHATDHRPRSRHPMTRGADPMPTDRIRPVPAPPLRRRPAAGRAPLLAGTAPFAAGPTPAALAARTVPPDAPRFATVRLSTGVRLLYAEQGDAARPAVILLHGLS